ncbi:MAG TPA: hypothetical protein VMZ27_03110 [Candidatus Saccharimonadales bacterium]|nr:hypothetical protein [Candidatus Saccharimonadales bacterium]
MLVKLMMRRFSTLWLCVAMAPALLGSEELPELDQPPHNYWKRPLRDRFTELKAQLESGVLPLDRSSERSFVVSLLRALGIPASSQMLVFSTTSLQLSLISPSNPRALYFSEDVYLGYVPGGRIEVLSIDPELGGIFYIFNIPKSDQQSVQVERSQRCMNCHAGADSRHIPGLVIKSVVPGPRGGSLTAYRTEESGHQIPFAERFGGWYVTGIGSFTNHWGNLTGRLSPEGLSTYPVPPGTLFDKARYPVATSDVLPQLLHEHQTGFINRMLEAIYKERAFEEDGAITSSEERELGSLANGLARYILFADEARLPRGGIEGDAEFKKDFLKVRRTSSMGLSLKDFELKSRLFKHRCSYMIYTALFQAGPKLVKELVLKRLSEALDTNKPNREFSYLPDSEKKEIHDIIKETVQGLPPGW